MNSRMACSCTLRHRRSTTTAVGTGTKTSKTRRIGSAEHCWYPKRPGFLSSRTGGPFRTPRGISASARHLAAYRPGAGPQDLVFVGRRGGASRRTFAARVFNPAVERAGLDPGLTFPGLRKVATSYMVDDGVHPRVIQHRLGHATARLSQELYAHVSDAADQDAATPVSARVSSRLRAPSGHGARSGFDDPSSGPDRK
jgi:hypothetical protein